MHWLVYFKNIYISIAFKMHISWIICETNARTDSYFFQWVIKFNIFRYHQMYIICKTVSFSVIEFDNRRWPGHKAYGSHTYLVVADLNSSQVCNFKHFSA